MNRHRVSGPLLCFSFSIAIAGHAFGQALPGRRTGAATVAATLQSGQVPPQVVANYTPPEERQNQAIQELQAAVNQLQSEVSALRAQLDNIGPATRTPVPLTRDEEYPTMDGKSDDNAEISNAIKNLWRAIELLKKDIRKVNGQP